MFEADLTKRAFLRRVTLGVSTFVAAMLASRGKAGALGLNRPVGEDRLLRKRGRMLEVDSLIDSHTDFSTGHQDNTDHVDEHTDSGDVTVGELHADDHEDLNQGHADTDGHTDDHVDVNS